MRHRNSSTSIGRKPDQAKGILRNMTTSVLLYERIRTTKKRAQVVRPLVEKVITIAKRTSRLDLAIRRIRPLVSDDNACRKVLEVLRQRYANRPSGYTRMTPLGMRGGDGALLCELSLVDAVLPGETPVVTEAEEGPKKKSPARRSTRSSKASADSSVPASS